MIPVDEKNIVILETNSTHRDYLRSILSQWGYNPISFDKESICLDNLSLLNPDLVISGSLSLERTFRFINTLKLRNSGMGILIVSDDQAIQDFININGFVDVRVIKPHNQPPEIKKVISTFRDKRSNRNRFQEFPMIIGNTPEMIKVKKMISELRRSKDTVLIQGEEGTGKDLVARALHYKSDRRNNPFVKVKSDALSCDDLESRLFGYDAEMLKDSNGNKKGMFEVADTGTIFLDNIEKMPASFQPRLLQILEGGDISSNDSETKLTVDVRIIAATSTDLSLCVKKGEFRKDLFYRLNVVRIDIPPLRNRIEDIFLLTAFFYDEFCGELGRSHYDISRKVIDIFSSYHWPKNVSELKNNIKNFLFHGNDDILEKQPRQDIKHGLTDFANFYEDIYALAGISDIKKKFNDLNKVSLKGICMEAITRIEKKMIKRALEKTKWNRKKAATLLNISYKSLLNKMKAYDLT